MPKQVDHEERRTRIAKALWRTAELRGIDRVSLREVAAEAEMSLGQLQHYFSTREEMLVFAVEFMSKKNVERVAERVAALGPPSPRVVLRAVVLEMLPVDDRAKTGSLMNIGFLLEAARNPTLREYAQRRTLALRNVVEMQLALAIEAGDIPADRDAHAEAAILVGLADGLRTAFHLGAQSAEATIELVEGHVDRLFA